MDQHFCFHLCFYCLVSNENYKDNISEELYQLESRDDGKRIELNRYLKKINEK